MRAISSPARGDARLAHETRHSGTSANSHHKCLNVDTTQQRSRIAPTVSYSPDCPAPQAALQCVLSGYGLPDLPSAALGEIPQTTVQPAERLTELAAQAGLLAHRRFVPIEYLASLPRDTLPALVWAPPQEYETERILVLWQQVGPWVQVMDTTQGVRWLRATSLPAHSQHETILITLREWEEAAASPACTHYWQHQLVSYGFAQRQAAAFLDEVRIMPGWYPTATLDAVIRMVGQLVAGGAIRRGSAACTAVKQLFAQALSEGPVQQKTIPADYWSLVPAPDGDTPDEQCFWFSGTWLVELAAPPPPPVAADDATTTPPQSRTRRAGFASPGIQIVVSFLRLEGIQQLGMLAAGLIAAAGAIVLQALLLRSAMTLGQLLPAPYQIVTLVGILLFLVVVLFGIEWQINRTVARIGRRLDVRLRIAVLERLRTTGTHKLQQHATADQMERIHASRDLHNLPEFVTRTLHTTLLLVFTLIGITWIDPLSGVLGLVIAFVTIAPFWLGWALLDTLNLAARTRLGRLMRFYLDGMIGLVPIQVHSAEAIMEQTYERHLSSWISSVLELAKAEFWIAALEQLLSHILIAATVLLFVVRGGNVVELPLLLFWLFQLALLGRDLARQVFRTLNEQSKCTRFANLLHEYDARDPLPDPTPANEDDAAAVSTADADDHATPVPAAGIAIRFHQARVQAGETMILHPFDLDIAAGSHVAIVGPSGAGKSTLVGLLAVQHQLSSGSIAVDGHPLTSASLADLRAQTAWVDPLVQIWNRSLLYNLAYSGNHIPVASLVEKTELRSTIAKLPDGMQTVLGERGRLVSGGQGQRVRLGRSMQRAAARLVILDEPFRGLDRDQRATLLARARAYWSNTTLLCITHDISQTTDFDRVLVVEGGRIVEDAAPALLRDNPTSHYRALLDAEQVVREHFWGGQDVGWRSVWLEGGTLHERTPAPRPATASPVHNAPPLAPHTTPAPPPSDSEAYMLSWHCIEIDAAVSALAAASGLQAKQPAPQPDRQDLPETKPVAQQIAAAASRLNLEVEQLEASYGELEQILSYGAPALIALSNGRLLLLSHSNRWWVTILAPRLRSQRVPLQRVYDLISLDHAAPLEPELDQSLAPLRLAPDQQVRARQVLLKRQLADQPIDGIWLLRLPAHAPFWRQIRQSGLLRYLAMGLGGELIGSLLYVAAFAVLLLAITSQQLAWGWLVAVLLIILLRVPAEMTRWLGEQFIAVGLRDIIKRRLFYGVLRLRPDDVKHHGTGQFLGWVMESERLEQAAQAVPYLLSTLVALGVAGGLLFVGAGGILHGTLLLVWLLVLGVISRGSLQAYLEQRTYHHQMTRDLLERMEGHQTRLVQEDAQRWHEEEDQELTHYHYLSVRDDYYRTLMMVLIPYGWLVVSLIALLPALVMQSSTWAQFGSSFLGMLLVFQLLRAAMTDVFDLIRAIGARQLIKPIEEAATRAENAPTAKPCNPLDAPPQPDSDERPLLAMQQLRFTYPHQPAPTLTECTLDIYAGNRLLLVGPSGGGKSTLAALLAGQRVPQSGLLLLHGIDQPTLGTDCWRRHVVIAPQFHENHLIEAPLLFNLLLGRSWPPSAADVAAAEALCHELGLAPLVQQMPSGLYEPVGETGWRLSHGERSRVYIARALLQGASIIILDESFGSLDPHSMQAALRCALNHAHTLVVIAHP